MPRDAGGNYTLPAGNPVAGGTVISVTWANPTMDDLAVAMTESLSRAGNGGMLVPFENIDGTVIAPGITFGTDPSSGIYRAGTSDLRMAIGGEDTTRWIDASAQPIGEQTPFQIWNGDTWNNALYNGGPVTSFLLDTGVFNLFRDTDIQFLGIVQNYQMNNDNAEVTNYARITMTADGVLDGIEEGRLALFSMQAGALVEQLRLDQAGVSVLNGNLNLDAFNNAARLNVGVAADFSAAIQVSDGGYIQLRPDGNTFDWRIHASVGTTLDFYQGAELVNPVMSIGQTLVSTGNDLVTGGTGLGELHFVRFKIGGMSQPITNLLNAPDEHLTIRGASGDGGTLFTSINNEDASVFQHRIFTGLTALTVTTPIASWRAGVGNGGTGFANAANNQLLFAWRNASSVDLFTIDGGGNLVVPSGDLSLPNTGFDLGRTGGSSAQNSNWRYTFSNLRPDGLFDNHSMFLGIRNAEAGGWGVYNDANNTDQFIFFDSQGVFHCSNQMRIGIIGTGSNGFQVDNLGPGGRLQTNTSSVDTHFHHFISNGNGTVGNISSNGTTTTFNTSSDPRLKTKFEEITNGLDMIEAAHDAGAIGLAGFLADPDTRYPMFNGQWIAENQPNTGGSGRMGAANASMDYGKRTPLHEAAIYELLKKVTHLESRLENA